MPRKLRYALGDSRNAHMRWGGAVRQHMRWLAEQAKIKADSMSLPTLLTLLRKSVATSTEAKCLQLYVYSELPRVRYERSLYRKSWFQRKQQAPRPAVRNWEVAIANRIRHVARAQDEEMWHGDILPEAPLPQAPQPNANVFQAFAGNLGGIGAGAAPPIPRGRHWTLQAIDNHNMIAQANYTDEMGRIITARRLLNNREQALVLAGFALRAIDFPGDSFRVEVTR